MSWTIYLRLGRVSNLPTVWTNVLAGAVLAGASLDPGLLVRLLVALSLFYVAGMYLNDAFDREIDARERPERPIPAGHVSATSVFAIGYGLLAAAVGVLAVHALQPGPPGRAMAVGSGVLLAGLIVYYDAQHKGMLWSPVVMGLCRVLVYVTAALAAAGRLGAPVVGGAAILLSYLIGLTYVAKQENLTAYRNLWPLACLFAPFVYGLPTLLGGALGAAIYLGFLGWVGHAVWLLIRPGRPDIRGAVVSMIAGISLLDALLIAGSGGGTGAVWALSGFVLTLVLQRWVPGT